MGFSEFQYRELSRKVSSRLLSEEEEEEEEEQEEEVEEEELDARAKWRRGARKAVLAKQFLENVKENVATSRMENWVKRKVRSVILDIIGTPLEAVFVLNTGARKDQAWTTSTLLYGVPYAVMRHLPFQNGDLMTKRELNEDSFLLGSLKLMARITWYNAFESSFVCHVLGLTRKFDLNGWAILSAREILGFAIFRFFAAPSSSKRRNHDTTTNDDDDDDGEGLNAMMLTGFALELLSPIPFTILHMNSLYPENAEKSPVEIAADIYNHQGIAGFFSGIKTTIALTVPVIVTNILASAAVSLMFRKSTIRKLQSQSTVKRTKQRLILMQGEVVEIQSMGELRELVMAQPVFIVLLYNSSKRSKECIQALKLVAPNFKNRVVFATATLDKFENGNSNIANELPLYIPFIRGRVTQVLPATSDPERMTLRILRRANRRRS